MLWICQSSVRFSTNVMNPLKADINRNCSKGSIKFLPGLYASPPESVITVSFVTDEPVMHSAVTMNIPLRITVASRVHLTADIYPKTLVSHTCGGHTPPHSFQTLSCLFFSIQQTSTTSVCQEIFVTLCSSSRVEPNLSVDRLTGLWSSPDRYEGLWSVNQYCSPAAGRTLCRVWCGG